MGIKFGVVIALILIVLLLGGLLISYFRTIEQAYERLASLDREVVDTSCGAVEVALRGRGRPLLLVHGSAGGFDQALDLAQDVPAGYRIIAPSRFGYLGSPMPEQATVGTQTEAFICLLDELGIETVDVMAYSAGGPSALLLAQNHPERVQSLVLVSTAVVNKEHAMPPRPILSNLTKSDFAFWLMSFPLRPLTKRMFVPAGLEMSKEAAGQMDQTLSNLLPIKPRSTGLIFDMYTTNLDPFKRTEAYDLASVQVPTLIINAKDDPAANFEDAKKMARSIPNAQFMPVESGGHMMLDNGDKVRRRIEDFLANPY